MSWCVNCIRNDKAGYRVGFCEGNACTRCPWAGCPCTHTGGCDRGFIEVEPNDEASLAQAKRCPTCHEWALTLKLVPREALGRVS